MQHNIIRRYNVCETMGLDRTRRSFETADRRVREYYLPGSPVGWLVMEKLLPPVRTHSCRSKGTPRERYARYQPFTGATR
jgi:hypothetical protein